MLEKAILMLAERTTKKKAKPKKKPAARNTTVIQVTSAPAPKAPVATSKKVELYKDDVLNF